VGGGFIGITLLLRFFTGQFQHALVRSRTFALELAQEVAEHERTEEELERYQGHLEELVQKRTRELGDAQAELVRRERLSALGQLTATVAHEIRNPLGTVRTSVFSIGDAIERDEMSRVERALQLAERNIIRCDGIIVELLDYTRDRVLQLEPTPIDTWLEMVLDEQPIPPDIVCTRELDASVQVLIDGENFRRAIVNVIDNAIHALQDEESPGDQLTVGAHVVKDGAGRRLEIRIGDTGYGIPADVLPRVFEPLFSTKSFGVGLGLPIVKDILELHGGGVEIRSKESEGTTVTLWLPVQNKEA
jgi:signal transduction histidine kinase